MWGPGVLELIRGVDSVLPTPSTLWVWHSAQVENGRGWVGNHEGIGPCSAHTKKKHDPQLWPSYQLVVCGFSRLSSPKFSNEKNRRGGKRNTKRQYSPNSSKYRLKEAKNVRGKKCLGFMVRPKLLWDNKLCAMINVPQWVTKYKQIHCQVCLFTCASLLVRVPKWRVSIHQNQLTHTHTHKMIHMKLLRKQADKFILTQIAFDFCQSVKSLTLPRHYLHSDILFFRL